MVTSASFNRIHQTLGKQAAVNPNAIALIDFDGRALSYAELELAVDQAVDVLLENHVAAGDRILIVTENCISTVCFIYAASRLDVWAIPVNARITDIEIERIMAHASPRLLVFTSAASAAAKSHAQRLDATVAEGLFGTIETHIYLESNPEPVQSHGGQVAVMIYTTGTTGQPKGVMLSHDNLLFSARSSIEVRELTSHDKIYGALPLSHVFGLTSIVIAGVLAGATIDLYNRFDVETLYQALMNGVTVLPIVPQMHALLMDYTHSRGAQTLQGSKLRYVSSGGAPLDPMWKQRAESFYGIGLQNGYGMTEAPIISCTTGNNLGDDISVGKPVSGVNIELSGVSESGAEVGEIKVYSPNVMVGYYKNPAETHKVIDENGWLMTGDLGRLDEFGKLHIVGRSKELIIHSGFNVYPQEVEQVLNTYPEVIMSAVIGRQNNGNEEILAFVQHAQGVTLSEATLKDYVKQHLVAYKCPSRIVITTLLPAATTGKILKHKLIDVFSDELNQ